MTPPTGRPRGRPVGAKSKRTKELEVAVQEAASAIEDTIPNAFKGDAHALLMTVYKDPLKEMNLRIDAAKAAIRYEKPALSSVEAKLDANVKSEPTEIAIRLVKPVGTPAT